MSKIERDERGQTVISYVYKYLKKEEIKEQIVDPEGRWKERHFKTEEIRSIRRRRKKYEIIEVKIVEATNITYIKTENSKYKKYRRDARIFKENTAKGRQINSKVKLWKPIMDELVMVRRTKRCYKCSKKWEKM